MKKRRAKRVKSAEEFADQHDFISSFPTFAGVEPYWELFRAGRVMPFMTLIRVTLGGNTHLFYCADEEGKLVSRNYPEVPGRDPKEIFCQYDHDGRWSIESIVPKKFAVRRDAKKRRKR